MSKTIPALAPTQTPPQAPQPKLQNPADPPQATLRPPQAAPTNIFEQTLALKIHLIRGQKVMLDSDLAEIYGYTTKAFNQQVKNNMEKFEGEDFMFRLSEQEASYLSRSNFLTSMQTVGVKGGRTHLPYAFTEQGIYMLMTVLKGELATRQSRALVMAFKAMKDYVLDSQSLIPQTIKNSEDILALKSDVNSIKSNLTDMLRKSDLSPIALNFSKAKEPHDFLIMNGEVVKAKDTIIGIYNQAKNSITIIDNYVSYKTLRLLLEVKPNLNITIYTNNTNHYLKSEDLKEFSRERPDLEIKLIRTKNIIHDRFIILDNNHVYTLGASSKDAGHKLTTIHKIQDEEIKQTIIKLSKPN